MAENYTFRIVTTCAGGEHITLRILKDGSAYALRAIDKSDIINPELTWNEVLPFLLNKIITNARATTPVQRKNAIESAVITL